MLCPARPTGSFGLRGRRAPPTRARCPRSSSTNRALFRLDGAQRLEQQPKVGEHADQGIGDRLQSECAIDFARNLHLCGRARDPLAKYVDARTRASNHSASRCTVHLGHPADVLGTNTLRGAPYRRTRVGGDHELEAGQEREALPGRATDVRRRRVAANGGRRWRFQTERCRSRWRQRPRLQPSCVSGDA